VPDFGLFQQDQRFTAILKEFPFLFDGIPVIFLMMTIELIPELIDFNSTEQIPV